VGKQHTWKRVLRLDCLHEQHDKGMMIISVTKGPKMGIVPVVPLVCYSSPQQLIFEFFPKTK
jgi:hypothetical protein